MVHALQKIHELLEPGGILVDLHPIADMPKIDVRIGTQEHLVGWLRESKGREQYTQADDAISQAVEAGLFLNARSEEFTYHIYADEVSELVRYMDESWTDAITDDVMFQRATELMRSAESDQEVGAHEIVRISRLVKLQPVRGSS